MLAGATTLSEPIPGIEPVCAPTGSTYFGLWLNAAGEKLGQRYFTAPGLTPAYPEQYICDLQAHSWACDGSALVVGGSHLTDKPFCSAIEPASTYNGLPLYACDIHLIRLTP